MRRIVSVNSLWDSGYAKVFDPALTDKGLDLDIPDSRRRKTVTDPVVAANTVFGNPFRQ